jgi:hypothetical protein
LREKHKEKLPLIFQIEKCMTCLLIVERDEECQSNYIKTWQGIRLGTNQLTLCVASCKAYHIFFTVIIQRFVVYLSTIYCLLKTQFILCIVHTLFNLFFPQGRQDIKTWYTNMLPTEDTNNMLNVTMPDQIWLCGWKQIVQWVTYSDLNTRPGG